ncbi:hypothetical protein [Paenibacillus sp. P22]|uniref:hypothetical protein n=1 Tax=Paenibacillus sp. P22 TaxID=483908 RepID=UPI000434F142|nr:hypothetical protein [Paenibacillus sp. P22]CDN42028.1 Uncharacterized protein BN871_AT_00300 [Paenibacillus sp. P22]
MSYVLFVVGSAVEYFGMFALMFALFRFQVNRDFFAKVAIITLLMSQVSYFTRLVPEIGNLSTYLQYVLFVGILWYLFRVPLFHSIVINFAGLFVDIGVTVGCVFIISAATGITLDTISANPVLTASFQILSAVIQIGLAYTIRVKNWGFDWVPSDRRVYTPFNRTSAVITALIAFCIVAAFILTSILREDFEGYLVAVGGVALIFVPLFLFFALRKDREEGAHAESSD